jgi:hypothetical protein
MAAYQDQPRPRVDQAEPLDHAVDRHQQDHRRHHLDGQQRRHRRLPSMEALA